MVHLTGNEVKGWYICLETRLRGGTFDWKRGSGVIYLTGNKVEGWYI